MSIELNIQSYSFGNKCVILVVNVEFGLSGLHLPELPLLSAGFVQSWRGFFGPHLAFLVEKRRGRVELIDELEEEGTGRARGGQES